MTETQDSRREIALSADLAEIDVRAVESGVRTLSPVELYRLREREQAKILRMTGQFKHGGQSPL